MGEKYLVNKLSNYFRPSIGRFLVLSASSAEAGETRTTKRREANGMAWNGGTYCPHCGMPNSKRIKVSDQFPIDPPVVSNRLHNCQACGKKGCDSCMTQDHLPNGPYKHKFCSKLSIDKACCFYLADLLASLLGGLEKVEVEISDSREIVAVFTTILIDAKVINFGSCWPEQLRERFVEMKQKARAISQAELISSGETWMNADRVEFKVLTGWVIVGPMMDGNGGYWVIEKSTNYFSESITCQQAAS